MFQWQGRVAAVTHILLAGSNRNSRNMSGLIVELSDIIGLFNPL